MLSLTFQVMVKVAIVGWYELNKEYVAKNLCENRNKPQMKCCGKCYLKKQLRKAEENSDTGKQAPGKLNKIELAEFIVPQKIKFAPALRLFNSRFYNPTMQHMYGCDAHNNIFHPPSVFCWTV